MTTVSFDFVLPRVPFPSPAFVRLRFGRFLHAASRDVRRGRRYPRGATCQNYHSAAGSKHASATALLSFTQ
jgi:hypothetical protein